jgi:Sec-independent protein translocase protein TatA
VLGGVGVVLVGRQDLPRVSRMLGNQVGRVVGLLQGARARADQFATNNELKQLQNELRSGLRELDQVKTELAVAASSHGMVGRTLGANVGAVNRQKFKSTPLGNNIPQNPAYKTNMTNLSTSMGNFSAPTPPFSPPPVPQKQQNSVPKKTAENDDENDDEYVTFDVQDPAQATTIPLERIMSSEAQSERAVLEEEWIKQGIGFKARAEMGHHDRYHEQHNHTPKEDIPKSGSEILENIIKQNLIFDQYDRVVGKQEQEMNDRIEAIKEKRRKAPAGKGENNKED